MCHQDFRRGLQQAVRALDEPSMGHRRKDKVSEVQAAILAQKALLHSWLAQNRAHSRHMVIQFLEANLQMPLEHVVQAHQQMLVSVACNQSACLNALQSWLITRMNDSA